MKRETTKPRTTCESCADGECRHVAIIQRQAAELRRLRAERKELLSLVALLPEGYPDNEWEGFLHEEGCNGVRHRRYSDGGRDIENECKCDGDYNADRIKAALKPARRK